jgi:uncharacterized protein YdaU (DUF1376 family)
MSADSRLDYTQLRYGDLMVDTYGLSFFEQAAYLKIIVAMGANDGSLPTDPETLHRLLGSDCPEAEQVISRVLHIDRLFYRENQQWRSNRVDAQHKESRRRQGTREARVRGGQTRAAQVAQDGRAEGGQFKKRESNGPVKPIDMLPAARVPT